MGGVIAEVLRRSEVDVTLVTPANEISTWSTHTEEQHRIQKRLLGLDVTLLTGTSISRVRDGSVELESVFTEETWEVEAHNVVMTTSRQPQDALYRSLVDRVVIQRIGDCDAPSTIARAVYAGHRYARELDAEVPAEVPFRRESDLLAHRAK